MLVGLVVVLVILGIFYAIFVALPLEVGKNYFFLNARDNTAEISHLFSSFRKGRYLNIVKTLFLRDLYIFLWSLLLIIPGIIKSFEYTMIPYLMAENPNLSTKRAFELSKQMTDHNKFNIFVLQISFILWYILALIPCGLGFFFLMPYTEATFAEMYLFKRAEMLQTGFATSEELPGFAQQAETVF